MKSLAAALVSCAVGVCGGYYTTDQGALHLASLDVQPVTIEAPLVPDVVQQRRTVSGDFLAGLFAQRHHDWEKAADYLENVMHSTPNDAGLVKRAMVLAMGAGDVDKALGLAKTVSKDKQPGALARLFLTVGAFHDKDYKAASAYITAMPPGSLSDFVMPLLKGWADAANGVFDVTKLSDNVIHLEHATMIADFMKKDFKPLPLLDKLAASSDLTIEDMDRLAKLYIHIGEPKKAEALYKKITEQWPDYPKVAEIMGKLAEGKKVETLQAVETAEGGIAIALYDMANLLYRESADDSARVFARMALHLAPSMTSGHLLMAFIATRAERYDEAIEAYHQIGPEDEYYLDARRHAADLMEDANRTDDALAALNTLVRERGDLHSLIKIGDIYRKQENFTKAIEVYNEAATKLGGTVPKEYWNLLYVRGISYERAGQWDKAEADLRATVAYQPNHPFVLNYLGYAWADQGIHLDEALDLLQKAAASQPNDGYISDSLGWVFYRKGDYAQSLPHLEKAIELLPYDSTVNDHLGDAYWQVGRKREARFQWQRAKNFSKDDVEITKIADKLANGLSITEPSIPDTKAASALSASGAATAIP